MIEIKQLTKRYGDLCVLENANFTFPEKGLVCLLGPSGCGKSTLLNLLAGFDRDYQGEITVCGSSITSMSQKDLCAYRRDFIGFIFQNYCLLPGYSVTDNILLPCTLHNVDHEEQLRHAQALLTQLGLSDKANETVENLSGGQKQRIAIARALIKNPRIILADEPTGALDRKNSTEIMETLKKIAADRLVIVITHDHKLCEYANEVISIEERNIICRQNRNSDLTASAPPRLLPPAVPSACRRAIKNLQVHVRRYFAIALSIALGVLAFLISISATNVMKHSIFDFKDKNIAFHNGYIAYSQGLEEIYHQLQQDQRVEHVYYQYLLRGVHLRLEDRDVELPEKFSQAKATQALSYGIIPRFGEGEIALSPSLAKKFTSQINTLIGKQLVLTYEDTEYLLTVSGIFNGEFDDFFISADLEQALYQHTDSESPLSISFDVIDFDNIVPIHQMLSDQGITCVTAAQEVSSLQSTFRNIQALFALVSTIVFGIGIFISTILLMKLQNTRYKELGLMSALGFQRQTIRRMIVTENVLLSCMAAVLNVLFVAVSVLTCKMLGVSFSVSPAQVILSVLATGVLLIAISSLASRKLLRTDPAAALRK